MSSREFKHNRKRNNGIVHELLMRHLTVQAVEKNVNEWRKTYSILKKYYSPNTPLEEEMRLFDAIRVTRGVNSSAARRILNHVLKQSKSLNHKILDIKKSNLIKEINYNLGKDFFSKYRIPEYRLLASIQMLFDSSRETGKLTENINRIKLEESLISFMSSSIQNKQDFVVDEQMNEVVYSIAKDKFKDKYNSVLNESQQKLLSKYSLSVMKNEPRIINEYIDEEKVKILSTLKTSRIMKEFVEDKIMKEKLEQAIVKLQESKNNTPEEAIEELLLYSKLVEELKSNE